MTTIENRTRSDPRLMAGVGFVAVFLAGLAPTFDSYPVPTSTPAQILAYFSGNHVVTSINELSQAVAAVGLLVFTAALAATFGGRAAPQLVAAGTLAASALFVGAALFNVLSVPVLTDQPALAAAVYHLGFMIGGPGHVVALAVLIGTTAVAGRRSGRLPHWLTAAGFVIAGLGLLSALNFATPMLPSALVVPFIPAGRFPGYLFLIATAVILRRERT